MTTLEQAPVPVAVRMPRYVDVASALAGLIELGGGTPEGVAEMLARFGVVGTCRTATRCALAEFLHRTVEEPYRDLTVDPSVSLRNAEVTYYGDDDAMYFGDCKVVPLPSVLNRFALGFDMGRYPALIDPAWPGEIGTGPDLLAELDREWP